MDKSSPRWQIILAVLLLIVVSCGLFHRFQDSPWPQLGTAAMMALLAIQPNCKAIGYTKGCYLVAIALAIGALRRFNIPHLESAIASTPMLVIRIALLCAAVESMFRAAARSREEHPTPDANSHL